MSTESTPTDDLGAEVELRSVPRRVVSLVPSLTEAVATTVPGVLAGATTYCTHPEDLDLPRVGGSKYPKVDTVLDQRPDLVLANAEENRPEDVGRLREAGVPVWVTRAPATVPAALDSLERLFATVFEVATPDWLVRARQAWGVTDAVRFHAVVPVWRKPWVVLGRDTFAGDVLRRAGIAQVYAAHPERYPRPGVAQLRACFADGAADLLVLPDEPYHFTAEDGPDHFPGVPYVLVSGRHLTWYGPALLEARHALERVLAQGPSA